MKNLIVYIVSVLLALISLPGCEKESLPVPPPPGSSSLEKQIETVALEESVVEESIAEPAENVFGSFVMSTDAAEIEFPDRVVFRLQGSSEKNIEKIELAYRTDKRALVSESNTIEVEFEPSTVIDASWNWEMKILGSLPPGVTIWWSWTLTDSDDNRIDLPEQSVAYMDTRFEWKQTEILGMAFYWNSYTRELRDDLVSEIEERLSALKFDVTIPDERQIKVFVYRDSEEIQGAVLFTSQLTGALAFPEYNTILTPVDESTLDWAKKTIVHEITHLLVNEYTFSAFCNLPLWLNEGLSVYSEGHMSYYWGLSLKNALENDSLLSIRSLTGSFPAVASQAILAYAQSGSIVTYLLEEYGWEKMNEFLLAFKKGSNTDNALMDVYGINTDELQEAWTEYLVTKARYW